MLIPDVNVLVDAWRAESTCHDHARRWLEGALTGHEAVGLADPVTAGAIRVLTMPIAGLAAALDDVLGAVQELRGTSAVTAIQPGRRHWSIFTDLCRQMDAVGNKVPDCYIAAFAIERDATLVSRDRYFEKMPGLSWSDLP